jgi:hypothetical protein
MANPADQPRCYVLLDSTERMATMSKNTMLLALAITSVALFALPAMASPQEIHWEPAEAFTIASAGGELRASGEPTLTCTKIEGTGKFDTGSMTTGTMTLDYTGCHMAVLGITASCKSEGAATAGTIASGGSFHLITISAGVPGFLLTTSETTLVCAGLSAIMRSGSLIGTIISPKCGESSKTLMLSFTATESTQTHLSYTGTKLDLATRTGSGGDITTAWIGATTITQSNAGRLNCT